MTCTKAVAAPYTVQHALGSTTIPDTPQRVITLFQGATDITVALGVKPLATVESWTEKPVYRYLRNDLEGLPMVGLESQPSLEDIARLKPDLIIASRFRNEKIYDLLSYIAPTVAVDEIYEFRENTRLIGQALNRQARARSLLDHWEARLAHTKRRLQEKFGAAWPLSVSILDFRSDHVRIYLANSFAGSVLSDLGFVWSEPFRKSSWPLMKLTSEESIPIRDADVFFVQMRSDSRVVQNRYDDWSRHRLWQQLKAVKNRQVYLVDNVYWSLAGGILSANLMLDELEQLLEAPAGGHK
ncbi:ABC transporter substrate-binding protein [Advenella mimigardefordensis]|nr:iron-siderophore ABC transporter substrate-binding protein [Advenella mimigardefordensis]